MKYKEMLTYTKRGLALIHKLTPSFIPLTIVRSLINAALPLLGLFMSARILNELTGARNVNRIIVYVTVTVLLTFALTAARALLSRKLKLIENAIDTRVFLHFGERYMDLDFEHVEKTQVNEMLADITAKITGNWLGLPDLYYTLSGFLDCIFTLILSAVLLSGMLSSSAVYAAGFITSPYAIALFAVLIVVSVISLLQTHKLEQPMLERIYKDNPKINTMLGYYNKYIGTQAAGKDVRLYNQQPVILDITSRRGNLPLWHAFFDLLGKVAGGQAVVNSIISGCIYLIIGLRALAGMYAIGSVVQYVGAVTNLTRNLTQLVSIIGRHRNRVEHIKQNFDYLDLPDIKYKGTLTTEKRVDNDYEIEFRNVSFKYPDTDAYALKNLSLKFRIGQKLAVVGMNGSGKTTMIKLLCRLYDPDEGEITLNGIDIRKYDYNEYISLFSVVFQDFKLHSFPLGQDVAAAVDYDREKADNCLRVTGFGERLQSLPKGLETALYKDFDEDGVQVSGGEAQRIALARALYKDSPFIILDEPTAALDPIAEYDIYTKFDEIVGERTAVYISHRLSSCRFCDDIAVFHEGELVQHGRHEALLNDKNGKYRELWDAQAQYYADTTVSV